MLLFSYKLRVYLSSKKIKTLKSLVLVLLR